MKYRRIAVVNVSVIILCFIYSVQADVELSKELRNEVVGLFGVLLTPTIFTPASMEGTALLIYGRTITNEGEVPDFDRDIKSAIDESEIFATGRIGALGLSVGFGQGNEFEFSRPFIASVDVKKYLLEDKPRLDAVVDLQYSVIVLTEEKKINVSAPGFGVASINGILSTKVTPLVEPYLGLSLHFIYLNTKDEFIGVLRPIPKLGLQIRLFSPLAIGADVKLIQSKNLGSAWIWDVGIGLRF